MEKFDKIRSYRDHEVTKVINNLLNNKEFIKALSKFQLPRFTKSFPFIVKNAVKLKLRQKLKGVDTIEKFQDVIAVYMKKLIDGTIGNLTESGLSDLQKDKQYLFVSNHRDIALDPGMVSYLLHQANMSTVEIAIGDNLLKKDFASDLMRLNKSFLVLRSAQGREKLFALKLLSEYIHYVLESGSNVWIAQREGRAKDGIDRTDPPIIKMFHMGKKEKEHTLQDSINGLHIIPVSISYEYDPCDELKARELYEIEHKGEFIKDEESDIKSIGLGMEGYKGDVHVSFGKEIVAKDAEAVTIADQIDEQVIGNYKLHPSNYLAYEKLQMEDDTIGPDVKSLNVDLSLLEGKREEFETRYKNISQELRPYFLKMYANPVISKIA